jgi:hypothetical protein
VDVVGDDRLVQFYDGAGALLVSSRGVPDGARLIDVELAERVRVGGDRVLASRHVEGIDPTVRVLAVGVDTEAGLMIVVVGRRLAALVESRAAIRLGLIVIAPVSALLIGLIGFAMIRRAMRPVRALAQSAANAEAIERIVSLPRPAGNDEFVELAAAINELLARLDAARLRERNFIADVSHELRTPITVLRCELELASADADDPVTSAALASAVDEVDRLIELMQRLLAMARAEAELEVTGVADVKAEVERIVATVDSVAERVVEIRVECDITDPVPVEPVVLTQIASNLISNAVRHATFEVVVAAAVDDDVLTLRVSDDGPGFPADIVGDSFERFRTGPVTTGEDRRGTGLGLSIVYQLCVLVGGTVTAANSPTGGVVIVRLPLVVDR